MKETLEEVLNGLTNSQKSCSPIPISNRFKSLYARDVDEGELGMFDVVIPETSDLDLEGTRNSVQLSILDQNGLRSQKTQSLAYQIKLGEEDEAQVTNEFFREVVDEEMPYPPILQMKGCAWC